ncbi:MMPL family transporter [Spirochaetota bacterium]
MKYEEKIMTAIAKFVNRFYKWIPVAAVILFVLSIMAAKNIEFKTEMKDMLPEDNPMVKPYIEIDEHFAGGSLAYIIIEGEDKSEMIECAEYFVKELRKDENIRKKLRSINLKLDRSFVKKWGLMFSKAKDIENTKDTFAKLNMLPFITSLNDSFEKTYTGDEAEEEISTRKQENEGAGSLKQMETFFTLLRELLEKQGSAAERKIQGKKLAETFMYGQEYSFSLDDKMLIFSMTPDFSGVDFDSCVEMQKKVKDIIKLTDEKYPSLDIVYTGDIMMQADEQDALGYDMAVPAIVAIIVILILFIFSFNQLRAIIFSLITLIFGIVYMYGFVGITIKEINMMTSMMAVLLIGLGIDYGIQVITNFTTFRADGLPPPEALTQTYIKAGMGTMLAAITTAIGFFVLAATGYKFFQQFGIVMGMGIMTCFIAMMFILPSLLLLFGKKNVERSKIPSINYSFLPAIAQYTNKKKWRTLIIGAVVTVVFIVAALNIKFEYDLWKLEPPGMPSIIGYEKIMDTYGITPFTSMYIARSIREARDITDKLEEVNTVIEVNSIANFIPTKNEQRARLAKIRDIRNMPARFTAITYTALDMKKFMKEIQRLEYNIIEMGDLSVAGLGEDNKIVNKRNSMIREIMGAEVGKPGAEVFQKLISLVKKNPALYAQRLTQLDSHFAREMNNTVKSMASISRQITIKDLPEDVSGGLIDKSKTRYLVSIVPRDGIWDDIESMERFNKSVAKVSPKITGFTQIGSSMFAEIVPAAQRAAIYIFCAIFIFMLLTFRSIKYSLFASAPLLIGMALMLGIYPVLGKKFNFMHIMVLPLVIGMGIDFGIHLTHRFTTEQDVGRAYKFTGKAVFLSALTTMIGFGSLALIGNFPSVQSMGEILFFGITACLLASLVILPALLAFGKKITKNVQGN